MSDEVSCICPPVVINDHGDVSIFDAVAAAERYLEPIDVLNGELDAYDALGRRILAEVKSEVAGVWNYQPERVTLRLAGTDAGCVADLRRALCRLLIASGRPAATVEHADLHSLLQDALRFKTS